MKKKVPPELRFDERLAALRKEQGLTQQALAFTLGVNADMHLLAADEGGPDDDRKLRTERRFTDAGASNR